MTDEQIKGAFKKFPPEQQPERIPLELFDELAEHAFETFCRIGRMYIPNPHRKAYGGKTTTGDMDIVFVPHIPNEDWTKKVLAIPGIVAHVKNGPQLMIVYKYKGKQYMLDFIHTQAEVFEWR